MMNQITHLRDRGQINHLLSAVQVVHGLQIEAPRRDDAAAGLQHARLDARAEHIAYEFLAQMHEAREREGLGRVAVSRDNGSEGQPRLGGRQTRTAQQLREQQEKRREQRALLQEEIEPQRVFLAARVDHVRVVAPALAHFGHLARHEHATVVPLPQLQHARKGEAQDRQAQLLRLEEERLGGDAQPATVALARSCARKVRRRVVLDVRLVVIKQQQREPHRARWKTRECRKGGSVFWVCLVNRSLLDAVADERGL